MSDPILYAAAYLLLGLPVQASASHQLPPSPVSGSHCVATDLRPSCQLTMDMNPAPPQHAFHAIRARPGHLTIRWRDDRRHHRHHRGSQFEDQR